MSKLLKLTEEYRVDTEEEAKNAMEAFRRDAGEKGYTLKSCGYTRKEKKKKGEVIDSGFLIKVVKEIEGFWEEEL